MSDNASHRPTPPDAPARHEGALTVPVRLLQVVPLLDGAGA